MLLARRHIEAPPSGAARQESEAYGHNGNREQHVECHNEPENQRAAVSFDDPPMKIDLPASEASEDWPRQ
jgi:hypothetical protein